MNGKELKQKENRSKITKWLKTAEKNSKYTDTLKLKPELQSTR